jgi:hypothetical protein
VASLAAQLEPLADADEAEVALDTGLTYDGIEPVPVIVRKRGSRYDISDRGAAVRKADVAGWRETAERTVAEEGFNVTRTGVVFVPVREGRDIPEIAGRLARLSLAVYADLLALED